MKRKRRLKKQAKLMIFIIMGIFIVMFVKYQNNWQKDNQISEVLKILNEKNYDEGTLKLIHDRLTAEEIVDLENKEKIKNLELFIKEKYYLHKNLDRYLTYFTTHPEENPSDIIALVNVSGDYEGYSHVKEADLTKKNLILVNKYNKLAQSYIPDGLFNMNLTYAYENRKVNQEVNEAFIKMYKDAKEEGYDLFVTSAFRSFDYQQTLYNNYISMYGVDYANTVSAQAGFSEHQTGLALDILAPGVSMSDFKNTKEYEWLVSNSYKYGFILRYPENKTHLTGYAFESWHYRYLGEEIAKKVFDERITYDEYYAFYLDN